MRKPAIPALTSVRFLLSAWVVLYHLTALNPLSLLRFGPAFALALLIHSIAPPARAQVQPSTWLDSSMGMLQGELTARYGAGQRLRVQRGLAQMARFWQPQDGGAGRFEELARTQFAGEPQALDALFERLSGVLGELDGHLRGIRRALAPPDPMAAPLPVEDLLGGLDPGTHFSEDGFQSGLAFAVLLNFPLTSLVERDRDGTGWTRRQWAEAWLAERFSRRVPARVARAVASARAVAEATLAGERRLGPTAPPDPGPGDPREAIRVQYAQGRDAVPRQRALQKELERRVAQPLSPGAAGPEGDPDGPEGAPRYRALLGNFQAARMLDPYAPLAPTQIQRSLEEDCQLPETRLRPMLETLCGSPLAAGTARLIQHRLGRKLEPFDLWYDGFRPGAWMEGDLDVLVRQVGTRAQAPGADLLPALQRLCRPQAGPHGAALDALSAFWNAWAASGAALVDLEVWHWLYGHPDASVGDLRAEVLASARAVWNRAYAPVLGARDCLLLASGRHFIDQPLGCPRYLLGQLIAFQILAQAGSSGDPDATFARCSRLGPMPPDLWLQRAVGVPLDTTPLLEAAALALKEL